MTKPVQSVFKWQVAQQSSSLSYECTTAGYELWSSVSVCGPVKMSHAGGGYDGGETNGDGCDGGDGGDSGSRQTSHPTFTHDV